MKLVQIVEGPYEERGFIICLGYVMDRNGSIYEEEIIYESFREAYEDMADLAEGLTVEMEEEDDDWDYDDHYLQD